MVLARSKILVRIIHMRLFLHVLVIIITNPSCKIFKDSCMNHIRLFLRVLVIILTSGSCKIFKDLI